MWQLHVDRRSLGLEPTRSGTEDPYLRNSGAKIGPGVAESLDTAIYDEETILIERTGLRLCSWSMLPADSTTVLGQARGEADMLHLPSHSLYPLPTDYPEWHTAGIPFTFDSVSLEAVQVFQASCPNQPTYLNVDDKLRRLAMRGNVIDEVTHSVVWFIVE